MRERFVSCAGCGRTFATRGNDAKWCSEHCRKTQYAKQCIDCGATVDGTTPGRSQGRCIPCAARAAGPARSERQRARFKDRREMVERMWREGVTAREIAKALGVKAINSSECRRHGYDLPLRRTPEDIERMIAGKRAAR